MLCHRITDCAKSFNTDFVNTFTETIHVKKENGTNKNTIKRKLNQRYNVYADRKGVKRNTTGTPNEDHGNLSTRRSKSTTFGSNVQLPRNWLQSQPFGHSDQKAGKMSTNSSTLQRIRLLDKGPQSAHDCKVTGTETLLPQRIDCIQPHKSRRINFPLTEQCLDSISPDDDLTLPSLSISEAEANARHFGKRYRRNNIYPFYAPIHPLERRTDDKGDGYAKESGPSIRQKKILNVCSDSTKVNVTQAPQVEHTDVPRKSSRPLVVIRQHNSLDNDRKPSLSLFSDSITLPSVIIDEERTSLAPTNKPYFPKENSSELTQSLRNLDLDHFQEGLPRRSSVNIVVPTKKRLICTGHELNQDYKKPDDRLDKVFKVIDLPHGSALSDDEIVSSTIVRQDAEGDCLLFVAIMAKKTDIVLKLIDLVTNYRSIRIHNRNRQTSLHFAAITDDHKVVRRLMVAGVEVACQDWNGNTALHIACSRGYLKVAEVLLKPIQFEEIKTIKYPLPYQPIPQDQNIRNYEGLTCLFVAIGAGNTAIASLLLDADANINSVDMKSGKSSLHVAAEKGNTEVVKFILAQNGLNIEATTYAGFTATDLAFMRGHHHVVFELRCKGANGPRFLDYLSSTDSCSD